MTPTFGDLYKEAFPEERRESIRLRVSRYVIRPPLASGRLSMIDAQTAIGAVLIVASH